MQYTVTIDTGNAAFDGNPAIEVSRILAQLVRQIEESGQSHSEAFRLFDRNGNRVGLATFRPESV